MPKNVTSEIKRNRRERDMDAAASRRRPTAAKAMRLDHLTLDQPKQILYFKTIICALKRIHIQPSRSLTIEVRPLTPRMAQALCAPDPGGLAAWRSTVFVHDAS